MIKPTTKYATPVEGAKGTFTRKETPVNTEAAEKTAEIPTEAEAVAA
jgi:hypothetical protein